MQLPTCEYRVATRLANAFFCRHSRVHAAANLVDVAACRQCRHRTDPCLLPRPIPRHVDTAAQEESSRPWEYVSTARLIADTRQLAGRLPADLGGVAGIPRSGLLPAAYLAMILHLPLFELCRERGLRELGHGLRLTSAARRDGRILIVDDSVYGGVALELARQALRRWHPEQACLFAAIYPRPAAVGAVDLYARAVEAPHLFEWNLFNCNQTATFAFDLDGILCEDWQGDEETDDEGYRRFVREARPRWLPRRSVAPLIVTARLERHRRETEAWLLRHGVRVRDLVMGPWRDVRERRENYHAGEHKARAYALSSCRLFVESDERQAREIFAASGKPVLCPAAEQVYQ